MADRQWPTREAWAQNQRSFAWQAADEGVSSRLSDYASQAQIADLISRLRERWKELGRQMKTAGKEKSGPLVCSSWRELQYQRQELNRAINEVRGDKIAFRPCCEELLAPFREARNRAVQA